MAAKTKKNRSKASAGHEPDGANGMEDAAAAAPPPPSKKKQDKKKKKGNVGGASKSSDENGGKAKKPNKEVEEPKPVEVAVAPPSSSKKRRSKKKKKGDAGLIASKSLDEDGEKSKKPSKAGENPPPTESGESDGEGSDDDAKLTLEALDAISDDDSDAGDGDGDGESYDAEALALREMIQEGKFDGLLKNAKKLKKKNQKTTAKEDIAIDEEMEEVVMDSSAEEASADDEEGAGGDESNDDDDEDADTKEEGKRVAEKEDIGDDSEEESGSEDEEAAARGTQSLALSTALQAADRHLPWAETFAVVAPTPLPFGPPPTPGKKRQRSGEEEDDDEEEYVDVHDDLKREVAFYDNALEGALLARESCEKVGIPFTRPDDFFAEMVKSDDHMAKIKDRLIFETKKMEAVERRKSNKEQTVMAKERHAHRIMEKSKAKKAHMQSVEDWKKGVERGRGGLGGKVQDWQADEDRLGKMAGNKRANADKRYGFGGKRGRFKQNDSRTLNDMSGYNPRGGFGGVGQKSREVGQNKGGGGGGGKKRPGKRARDARR